MDRDRNSEFLRFIIDMQNDFLFGANTQGLFDDLLNTLIKASDSEYGFIGEVLEDEDGKTYLHTYAITDISWDAETQKFYEDNAATGLKFYNMETLFGDCIVNKRMIIANDAPNHAAARGIPGGHPALNRFLGIPLMAGAEMVGMVGLANRKVGYDAELVMALKPLYVTASSIINSHRLKRENDELKSKVGSGNA